MRRSGNPGSSHHVKPALHVSLTTFHIPSTNDPDAGLSTWGPDSRSLVASDVRNGTPNLWEFPLFLDALPTQLTHFDSGHIFNQRFSADGKFIAISKGTITSDAVLFTEAK
jgi:hypothetical protein